MNSNQFDDLFEKISKISDLSERVPSNFRNDVFTTLYKALKDGNDIPIQLDNIAKDSIDRLSLKTFIEDKKPASNIERSLLFVYYLENNSDEPITIELIAACYQICNLKEPGNLGQNLRDACSSRYGYLAVNADTYATTAKGKAFCNS